MTYFATLTAISLLLKMFANHLSFSLGAFKVGFSYIGWYLSAAVLGPLGGGIVAAIVDVVAPFVSPLSASFTPLITLGNVAAAVVFGLVFRLLPVKNPVLRALLAGTASALVGTMGINTYALYLLYAPNTNYLAYWVSRLLQLPVVYINVVLFALLLPALKRMRLLDSDYRSHDIF